jgi:hypothetical protein
MNGEIHNSFNNSDASQITNNKSITEEDSKETIKKVKSIENDSVSNKNQEINSISPDVNKSEIVIQKNISEDFNTTIPDPNVPVEIIDDEEEDLELIQIDGHKNSSEVINIENTTNLNPNNSIQLDLEHNHISSDGSSDGNNLTDERNNLTNKSESSTSQNITNDHVEDGITNSKNKNDLSMEVKEIENSINHRKIVPEFSQNSEQNISNEIEIGQVQNDLLLSDSENNPTQSLEAQDPVNLVNNSEKSEVIESISEEKSSNISKTDEETDLQTHNKIDKTVKLETPDMNSNEKVISDVNVLKSNNNNSYITESKINMQENKAVINSESMDQKENDKNFILFDMRDRILNIIKKNIELYHKYILDVFTYPNDLLVLCLIGFLVRIILHTTFEKVI